MDDFYRMLTEMAVQEGAVCISPHPKPFRRVERDFLDGIRKVPASIRNPPGVNPYSMALGRPGRWIFIWIPDK